MSACTTYGEFLMGDIESEQSQDDFEVEIADLDELGTAANSSKPARSLLRPRFSPRQRRLQLAITSSIVVLVILIILGSTAPVRELVGSILPGPTATPSAASASEAGLFYFQASPSWGQLSIDGHVVAHLAGVGSGPPLRLARGRHVLEWRAEPFLAQHCVVTVPTDYNADSCHRQSSMQVGNGLFASIITFSESLKMLPDTQRAMLIQAVLAELGAAQYSEVVKTGEPYALASAIAGSEHKPCRLTSQLVLCYAIAAHPLKATLSFQLNTGTSQNEPCTNSGPCSLGGQDCRLFCDTSEIMGPMRSSLPAPPGWNALVVVRPLWQYTTLDGQMIAHDQADTFIGGQQNEYTVLLNIEWENPGWSVSVPFSDALANPQLFFNDPVCDSATNDTQALQSQTINNGDMQLLRQYALAPDADLAAGCVVTISSLTPTPTASSPVAYFLHRFGVLLAVNEQAHRLWPFLPVANAYEKQLAQQLLSET
jgi:hypothetical protein